MGSYFWAVVVVAVYTLVGLRPLHGPLPLGAVSGMLGYLIDELPFLAIYWLVGWSVVIVVAGDPGTVQWVTLGIAGLTVLGLLEIIRRAALTGPAVRTTLAHDLGRTPPARSWLRRWCRILLAPVPLFDPRVERTANLSYGDAGRRHRLDLYHRRGGHEPGAPVLIHFHGGHFRTGGKSREARPLLHRFARRGWVCVSAAYRLGAAGAFPRSLVDAKAVVAWVRRHAQEYGVDPSVVVVAGSSAGAHLASMVALTPDEPAFQPGFEDEDTSVAGAVCLYGFLGERDPSSALPSSPTAYLGPDAPPFFVAHGTDDTLVPVAWARRFVDRLRRASTNQVAYLELPGAQHSFDNFHSLRFEQVVDAIEVFTDEVC
ncbi:alpha/beta hydrolase [Ornithinimicrobium sp. F0845]|uniref:alpha/beta hydrolase n=1 Tax=Ornithinimicrobium sp. F0845 TaxID=2926412 RepID=UPI00248B3D01|nr:alpha/beta hydrolase [Ornithinimicrobium sp. F0845]